MENLPEDDFLANSLGKKPDMPLDVKSTTKESNIFMDHVQEADLLSLDNSKHSPSESESLSSEINLESLKKDKIDFPADNISALSAGSMNDLADFLKAEAQFAETAPSATKEVDQLSSGFDSLEPTFDKNPISDSNFSSSHLEHSDDDHLFQPMHPTKVEPFSEPVAKSQPLTDDDFQHFVLEPAEKASPIHEADIFDANKPVPPPPEEDDGDEDEVCSYQPPVKPVETVAAKEESPPPSPKCDLGKSAAFCNLPSKPKVEPAKPAAPSVPKETSQSKVSKSALIGGGDADLTIGPQDFFNKIGLGKLLS